MLNCKEFTDKASDFLDRALPLRERMMLGLHLLLCKYCRRYMEQLKALVSVLNRWPREALSESEIRRQVERLRGIG